MLTKQDFETKVDNSGMDDEEAEFLKKNYTIVQFFKSDDLREFITLLKENRLLEADLLIEIARMTNMSRDEYLAAKEKASSQLSKLADIKVKRDKFFKDVGKFITSHGLSLLLGTL